MGKYDQHRREQEKKKARIVIGGGNLGGLALWGGALAVASLMAAFAVKKRRKRSVKKDEAGQREEEGSQGLRHVLEAPSSTDFRSNPRCTSLKLKEKYLSQIDSRDNESLIWEENSCLPKVNCKNENSSPDDLHKIFSAYYAQLKCTAPSNMGGHEESSMQSPDVPTLHKMENGIDNDSGEESLLVERVKLSKNEAADDDDERKAVKKNHLMHPVLDEDEDEDGDIGDDVDEEEEEADEDDYSSEEYVIGDQDSSEGGGSPDTESNTDAIWPAEVLTALSLELENVTTILKNAGEKVVEENRPTKTQEWGYLDNSRRNIINNGKDDHEPAENSKLIKERDTTEHAGNYNKPHSKKWRTGHLLSLLGVLVLLVLLFLMHPNVVYLLNSDSVLVP